MKQLTPEQQLAMRRIQASMAIEGYDLVSDEEAANIIREADESGATDTVRRLVHKARVEGRPEREVFREHFGAPSYHRRKN